MPASGIRFVMFMQADRYGISEEHVYNSLSFTIALPACLALFKARMAMCGFGVVPFGGRLSILPLQRSTSIFDDSQLAGIAPGSLTWNVSGGGVVTNDADQPKSCVTARLEGGSTRRRVVFLGGIPDVIVRENPAGPDVTDYPAWNTAFAAYKALLLSGSWGFANKAPQTAIPVIGVDSDPSDSNLRITVSGATAVFAQGQFVDIHKFTRSNVAYASANGHWQIKTVAINAPSVTVSYTLFNSATVSPLTITRLGTVQGVDFQFTAYTDVKLRQQGTRKRGNRFLVPPGTHRVRRPVAF